ncbi:tachylectin-related carbohydrate-binding protein [Micromonospora sp. NPDC049799]|uniref:tachylectin-related carbohydrate-binding protein n=1 Tax=Micromonospora sp. NPDC049799 TaxID=3154741 RepID=UPI0033FE7751
MFFNSTSTGTLVRRTYSTPGRTGGTWTSATTIGSSGWTNFGRLLGGPDGRVYGINSAGLTRYRWTGTQFEYVDGKQNWLISSSFQGYAGATLRDKITVDERGDFYLIDGKGMLRWYRFDETSRTWTISGRILDTGWDRYNLLVATSPGVLYGRAADGQLYRHRFDPVSQRWISRDKLVGGTGFGSFTKGLFSAGGDTLYGIQADGELYQYRYREDTLSWELVFHKIGSGWGFPNVFTTTNTCTQGAVASPARPATPIQENTPVAVMQAPAVNTALGTLEVAYTDNIGRLLHGRANPDAVQEIQWAAAPGNEAHTGKPALVANSENKVALLAHETDSDIRMLMQKTAGMPDWNPWLELGGAMKSEPATVRLSDGKLVVFATDASGALWYRWHENPTSDLMAWTSLGGSGFTGTPVVVAGANGAATVLVNTTAGTPQVATWQAGALTSGWTSLGGTGLTGTPSTVLLPGPRLMVFGTHSDGSVRTQVQNTDGTWPNTWTTIGDTSLVVPQGPATAVLSPTSGRVWVFVRGADGTIYGSVQTSAGSSTWNAWTPVTSGETYVSDPTAFTWQNSGGFQIGFAVRTLNGSVRLWATDQSSSVAARTAVKTDGPFVRHDLPAPPR